MCAGRNLFIEVCLDLAVERLKGDAIYRSHTDDFQILRSSATLGCMTKCQTAIIDRGEGRGRL